MNMIWVISGLVTISVILGLSAWQAINGSGSADQRAGGAALVVLSVLFAALAGVCWLIAVTVNAFA